MVTLILILQSFLALFFFKPVLAVFSDEAGVIDWHRQSLGLLKASPAPGLYYSQHKSDHVIARINTTDGSIVWRKLLSYEANGFDTPLLLSNYVPENEKGLLIVGFSAQETCKLVSFDAVTGSAGWEVTVNGKCIDITFVKNFNGIYALTSDALYKIGSVAGAVLSQFIPELLHEPIEFAALSSSGIILEDTSAGSLLEYKFTEEHASQVKPHNDPFVSSPLVLGPGKVVAYSDNGHTVWEEENKASGDKINFPIVHLDSKGELQSLSSLADIYFLSENVVVTVQNDKIQAYSIETAKLIYTISGIDLFSKIDSTKFVITKDSNIEIIEVATGDLISKQPFVNPIALLTPSFIQYADGVVEPLLAKTEWSRDESLAHLDAAIILDYPDNKKGSLGVKEALLEEHSNLYVAYISRLSRHAKDLIWIIKKIAENPSALFSWSWLDSTSSADGTSADDIYFGFKKYFIAVSQTGRIQALDSTESGETVWVKDLFDPHSNDGLKFLVANVKENVTVIDPRTNRVITLDGITGNILKETVLSLESDDSVSRILTLYLPGSPKATEEDIDSVTAEEKVEIPVLLTTSDKLYTLEGKVFSSPVPIYITKTLEDQSALVGLSVNGTSVSQIWRFNVPSDHVIQNVASRHELDFTVNIGQVLSDRSVLYKYLHNNLLAVTATGPNSLYVYLLDSASGRILHSKHHKTGTGIDKYAIDNYTHLVVGENWIVYTYWATNPTLGQIVVVWDLYESEISNERTMAKKNKKGKLESAPYSSFENFEVPFVKSQAYYIPTQHARVTGLGITRTRYGITLRDVIAATSRNQILSLPKRGNFLSARRPIDRDPTSAEASEEGLSRYDSLLPYDPVRQVLSHTRQVARVSTLLTVPTVLESTSTVIGYGLDIFGTKVAPSGLFDVLTPSFGRDKLIYTMAAMTGLALYLKPLVAKRKTNNFWGN